jgi:hypothetical protein
MPSLCRQCRVKPAEPTGPLCYTCRRYKGQRCQHCRRKLANRPRQLCYTCFGDATVRSLYPPSGKTGIAQSDPHQTARDPVAALPGSKDKVAALAARAASGLSLWHQRDGLSDQERQGCEAPDDYAAPSLPPMRFLHQIIEV